MFAGQRPTPLSLKRVSTITREPWSEPTSPVSVSWTEKSTAELVSLLKTAHASLREKDKDLTLAAELGHYLLEKNIALKSQYDELLCQQEQHDECSDDNDDLDGGNTLILLSQQQAHQRVLTELEDKNIELQRLLDDAQQQGDKIKAVHDKKARDLEYDITLLKNHLEMASQRIEEMEDDQYYRSVRQKQQYRHTDQTVDQHSEKQQYHQQQQQHDRLLVELRDKIRQLEYENNQLVHTRRLVQDRLDKALIDVDTLQTKCHLDEWTRERYTQLNDAYQQQFNQIAQLNSSLEEHRTVLSRLIDHCSHNNYHHSNSSPITCINNDDLHQNSHNNNLMVELEKVWYRDQLVKTDLGIETPYQRQKEQQQQSTSGRQHDNDDDGYSSLVSEGIKMHQQNTFDSAVYINTSSSPDSPPLCALDHVPSPQYTDNSDSHSYDHVNGDTGDDADLFGPQNAMDILTSYNLYPDLAVTVEQPKAPSFATLGMVNKAQRWCRFAIVLTVAVLINAFEGPDAMLDEMY